jgi:HJR/Mrr/RecB family endonuclease
MRFLPILAALLVFPIACILLLIGGLGLLASVSFFQSDESTGGALTLFIGSIFVLLGILLIWRAVNWIISAAERSFSNAKDFSHGNIHLANRAPTSRPGSTFKSDALTIEDVDQMTGLEFEAFVAAIIRCLGHAAEVTRASNDFGVDVIATVSGERIAIQAKRYSGNVSRTAVSDAVAAKSHYDCQKAAVVTCSNFTKSAIEFAQSVDCMLMDRSVVKNLLSEHGKHPDLVAMRKLALNLTTVQDLSDSENKIFSGLEPDELADCMDGQFLQVPENIRKQILADAAHDHPGDFGMQEYVFDEQCKSYVRLYFGADRFPDIPNEIKRQFFASAMSDHPDDFGMQEYVFEEQCKSYRKIQRLNHD